MKEKQLKSPNIDFKEYVLNDKSTIELILDNLPFSTWLKDEKGNYLAVNKMGAEMAGMSKEELIGKNDFEVFPKVIADIFSANDHKVIKSKSK